VAEGHAPLGQYFSMTPAAAGSRDPAAGWRRWSAKAMSPPWQYFSSVLTGLRLSWRLKGSAEQVGQLGQKGCVTVVHKRKPWWLPGNRCQPVRAVLPDAACPQAHVAA
jgi:hypothetical protein